jgi:hypothetical protein
MTDYSPTVWQDNVTPVNATNLNKLEGGVDTAHQEIDALDLRLDAEEAMPDVPSPVVNGQWIRGAGGVLVYDFIEVADVSGLQTALDAKVDDTEKGAASGVATLDSGTRVVQSATVDKIYSVGQIEGNIPIVRSGVTVWEPVPAGGSDLNFSGDWSAATPYEDGEIVTYNGVLYMCVEPTQTAPPENWGVGGKSANYGTALPATPVDNQVFVLVDSLTAPTYQWTFMYMADILDAYKWVCIGGGPKTISDEVSATVANSAGVSTVFTPDLSMTVPLAGNWLCGVSAAQMAHSQAAGGAYFIIVQAGAQEKFAANLVAVGNVERDSGGRLHQFDGLAANDTVRMRGGNNVGSITVVGREVTIQPLRVA